MKEIAKVRNLCVMVSIAIAIISCDTSGNVEPVFKDYYIKYFGEDGDQEATDLVVNNDGTLVILGATQVEQQRWTYLLKVDSEGNEIWKRKLGASANEIPRDIEPIIAGQYAGHLIVLSNVERSPSGFNVLLRVVDQNGTLIDSVLVNNLETQQGYSVTPLSTGGYYLSGKCAPSGNNAGLTDPGRTDEEDALVVLIQQDLTYNFPESFSQIGRSYLANAVRIFENAGGSVNFFYAGYTDELLAVDQVHDVNFVFRTFNENPNSLQTEFHTGSSDRNQFMSAIARSPFGSYLAVGTQTDNSGGDKRLFVTTVGSDFASKLNDGIINTGDSQAEAVAVTSTSASQFLVLANLINPAGNRNIYLTKVDFQTYQKEFEYTFGTGSNDDTASAVAELPGGDIAVLCTMHLTNQKKIALIKLRPNGSF